MTALIRVRFGRRLARMISARDDERGMALATVIIFGMVLLLLSATVVSVSVSGSTAAKTQTNWVAAGQAAYAGVEDYQSKLANDNTYSQYGALGNATTMVNAFSTGSIFTGTAGNAAFGLGTGAGTGLGTGTAASWQPVDPNKPNGASYRYEVDNSKYSASGILLLQSTGRVGNTTRTIVANLKQSGFLDYLYFTDYEITDPILTPGCTAAYQWAVTSRPGCSTISFGSSDTVNGPAHSNDTMYVCGSTFTGAVTTASSASGGYILPAGCASSPTFAVGGKPVKRSVVQMPSTVGSLIQETHTDLPSTVARPGCLYTGPTTFTFNGDGTWTVYSPWTQKTQISGNPANGGTNAPQCGTPGYTSGGNTLGSPGGQTLPVLDSNLAYVQNVPTVSTDPNYPSSSSTWVNGFPPRYSCTGADGKTAGDGVGFPAAKEQAPTSTSYSCTAGDAFVRGGFGGNATIAANNYVYITGDITYDNPSKDLLGLIGQNNVYVYNPIGSATRSYSCGSYSLCSTSVLLDESDSDRTIDAAIMSVAHSFTVQNYSADYSQTKGSLNVLGSIVQKFRGAVGTGSSSGDLVTGYAKNYLYDPRLAFQAPPKFLSPVSTSYGITQVTQTKTAMTASGAAQ